MKKKTRILAIILCIVTVLGMLAPLAVNAQPEDTTTEVTEPQETTTPDAPDAPDVQPEEPEEPSQPEEPKPDEPSTPPAQDTTTTGPATDADDKTEEGGEEKWDGLCSVTVKLGSDVPDKTDNIVLQFIPKGSLIALADVTLTRENNFTGVVRLKPDEYKIAFSTADNEYEVVLNENHVDVPEARGAELTVTAKKIQDGSFFATFLRNNSLLLILLAASSITYFVLKRRREKMYQ